MNAHLPRRPAVSRVGFAMIIALTASTLLGCAGQPARIYDGGQIRLLSGDGLMAYRQELLWADWSKVTWDRFTPQQYQEMLLERGIETGVLRPVPAALLSRGEIAQGMTKAEVAWLWGWPDRRRSAATPLGETVRAEYTMLPPGQRYNQAEATYTAGELTWFNQWGNRPTR